MGVSEMDNRYIDTIDFGRVPIRRTHTDGKHYADIELADDGTEEAFAEIRIDDRTNQPFAVLFDGNWNQL